MIVDYDPDIDILYVHVPDIHIEGIRRPHPNVVLWENWEPKVVGAEVLWASQFLKGGRLDAEIGAILGDSLREPVEAWARTAEL